MLHFNLQHGKRFTQECFKGVLDDHLPRNRLGIEVWEENFGRRACGSDSGCRREKTAQTQREALTYPV